MKTSPEYERAALQMKPGKIVKDGFLGFDKRSLPEIIGHDKKELESLGLSFDLIAEKLNLLVAEGKKGLGNPVSVEGTWEITVDEARGRILCPFEDGLFAKRDAAITRLSNRKKILVSELSLHLLSAHRFLQGKGSPFRLEPSDLKEMLDL
jgi:hypothetical protein